MANAADNKLGEERRAAIMDFLRRYAADNGYAPSYQEIAEAVDASTFTVGRHLKILQKEGKVEMGPGPRMIRVLED